MLEIQKKLSNSFYAILSLPATAMGFALSVQISALSWIMTTEYGLDLHEVGIVWSAGPIAGIIGQLLFGVISDKAWFWGGRRRPFILMGGTLAALSLIALPNLGVIADVFGTTDIIMVAIVVALTLDLSINISFNPTRSLITDVTPDGTPRTKGYTWMQTISGTFGVLAYAIGAILGNYVLIYFGVILVLAFSVLPMLFISEPKVLGKYDDDDSEQTDQVVKKETEWAEFIKVFLANAFSWIGVQTMFVYMIGYVNQYLSPVDNDDTGMIISVSFLILNAVGALLPAFVLEPLTEKIGRVKTHYIALAFMAAGYAGIVFFGMDRYIVFGLMAVAGIGWAAIVSLPFAIMSEKINQTKMGLFMGIFNLSIVLPQLFVSLQIGAWVEAAENKNLIFIIAAVSLAVSSILWALVKEAKSIEKDIGVE
ncbi:MAG: hypothetical protein SCALA702_35440 [Melioribacteraceae bacterium]|nr:MAG: hypothetical protein SCALA702_35440 [Melioribacteraceae bacterium]